MKHFLKIMTDNVRMVGTKHDSGKLRWHLMPFRQLEDVVAVLGVGADKYGVDNWKKVADARDRYKSALMRHFSAYMGGEVNDSDDGLHHLAHVICCALFLMWFDWSQVKIMSSLSDKIDTGHINHGEGMKSAGRGQD